MTEETANAQQSDPKQVPLVFSKSESIPLGLTNKLLRKAAYGFGTLSFVLTAASGITDKNHWRTACGIGSVGVNIASLFIKENDEPLPDTHVPGQMVHAITKPAENNLFFNRSATFITDVLKFAAGLQSAKKAEIGEGLVKIGAKAIDISGISAQDRREKAALEALSEGRVPRDDRSPINKLLFSNRWVSLGYSTIAAGLQVAQGIEGKKDPKMIASGLSYFAAVSCLCADNYIMESKLNKLDAARGR